MNLVSYLCKSQLKFIKLFNVSILFAGLILGSSATAQSAAAFTTQYVTGYLGDGKDCSGYDLDKGATSDISIEDCKVKCNDNKNCKGFSYTSTGTDKGTCKLKSINSCSKRESNGYAFRGKEIALGYVMKERGGCINDILANLNLQRKSLGMCVGECNKNPNCKGFNFKYTNNNLGTCTLRSSDNCTSYDMNAGQFWSKDKPEGYIKEVNGDCGGNDLTDGITRDISKKECAKRCDDKRTNGCQGFSFGELNSWNTGTCALKSIFGCTTRDTKNGYEFFGLDSAVKTRKAEADAQARAEEARRSPVAFNQPAPPAPSGFTKKADGDCPGNEMLVYGKHNVQGSILDRCVEDCKKSKFCLGISYNYKTTDPNDPEYNKCVTKNDVCDSFDNSPNNKYQFYNLSADARISSTTPLLRMCKFEDYPELKGVGILVGSGVNKCYQFLAPDNVTSDHNRANTKCSNLDKQGLDVGWTIVNQFRLAPLDLNKTYFTSVPVVDGKTPAQPGPAAYLVRRNQNDRSGEVLYSHPRYQNLGYEAAYTMCERELGQLRLKAPAR